MKKRLLTQVVALCALNMGLLAQDESQDPAQPAEGPQAETPAAEAEETAPAEAPEAAEEPGTEAPAEEAPAEEAAENEAAPQPETDPSTPGATPPDAPAPGAPSEPAADPALEAPANVSGPPAEAEKSDSGLAWIVLQEGTGAVKPGPTDRVKVHYTGWKTDGEMFDSSVKRGQPSTFPLNGVIKGWTEGLQLMVEGEKRRFWIPAELAYGENPAGGRPGGMLCFDIELLSVLRPHPTPENLTAAPDDAIVTESGLAMKVVEPGTGETMPKPLDNVQVHYTLWTTDGTVVDSSLRTGRPATFPLKRTIKGFTEALQQMVEGERRRIWIPEELAYGTNPPETAPKGMLIFEVELVKIFSN